MHPHLKNRPAAALLLGLLLAAATGCGSSHAKYVPSGSAARQALEAALTAWQTGQATPGKLTNLSPPVQVLDTRWKDGAKLERFEILDEETKDGPRWFSVRLTLKEPAKEEVARYAVLGIDPLWVYREEDYRHLSGM
jgi:hypothetical protein